MPYKNTNIMPHINANMNKYKFNYQIIEERWAILIIYD